MFKNFVTIALIPQSTSGVVWLRVPQLLIQFFLVLLAVALIGATAILVDYFDISEKRNDYLELQKKITFNKIEIQRLNSKIQNQFSLLTQYEKFDQKLRVISDLSESLPGVGTALLKEDLNLGENENNSFLANFKTISRDLKKLEYNTKLREISFFQLESHLKDSRDRLERTPSIAPIKGYITSQFGKRVDPFTGQYRMHNGVDWANRKFTPIYAPANGVVTATFFNGGYGNFLVIDHGYGIITRYAHLAKFEVSVGEKIKRGDLIARMGNSGRSTGTHLHYEVLVSDRHVNPEKYILE